MENELLIKALRYCADEDNICTEQTNCGYYGKGFFCQVVLLHDAADALEAAEKRIAELEAQLPKRGEWIRHGTDEDEFCYYECPLCGFIGIDWNYCPNCGARMKGEEK